MINSIKSDRRDRILPLLSESVLLSMQEVARHLGRVSAVTLCREVADAVTSLASRRASFITSEILRVDGDPVVRGE